MRHLIVGRMGVGDATVVANAPDEVVTELKLVTSNKRLDHGIGQALDDLRKLGVFPTEIALDLLIVAAHVYGADTRISRATQSQDSWTREIRLVVPVSDTAKWQTATEVLERMLNFLTGDRWEIGFRDRPVEFKSLISAKPAETIPAPFTLVSLFSGGLDSLIGAIDLLEKGTIPLLVSHAGEGATSDAQNTLFKKLKDAFKEVPFERLRIWMSLPATFVSNVASEETRRGRSFLFFSLGAFAGSGLGDTFQLNAPENGLIALNVPLDPLRLGALSTRTTHPFYIARWNDLLNLLGMGGRIENPYWDSTKGEMIAASSNLGLLKQMLADSLSCASPTKGRWLGHGIEHCGYCLPCLIRRASIKHALGTDPTTYGTSLASGEILDTKKAQGQQVRSFQFAANRLQNNPVLAGILIHKPGPLSDESPERQARLAEVYRRGLQEVEDLLVGVVTKPSP
jgi:hypothetical protein